MAGNPNWNALKDSVWGPEMEPCLPEYMLTHRSKRRLCEQSEVQPADQSAMLGTSRKGKNTPDMVESYVTASRKGGLPLKKLTGMEKIFIQHCYQVRKI